MSKKFHHLYNNVGYLFLDRDICDTAEDSTKFMVKILRELAKFLGG